MKRLYAYIVAALWFAAANAHAGETLKAWVDLRAVSVNGERDGQAGGYGKLRYGGETRSQLAQVAILWTPRLSDNITANVFVQDVPGTAAEVSEAYVKWKPVPTTATRYVFRVGQMFVPVSLEHDGPGWSLTRTLTPSAVNSWIGEEGLVDGFEANIQRAIGDHLIGATFGLFASGDTAGTILAFRGWTQHDNITGTGTQLVLPVSATGGGWPSVFPRQAARSRPLVEVDGRAGQYLRFDWRPPAPWAVNLVYVNNPGKPTLVKQGQYGWTTQYLDLGITARAAGSEILAQYLSGTTKMGAVFPDGTHPADIGFDAAYLLWSHGLGTGKLTGRFDYFAVKDHSLQALDNNSERGYSLTLAYMRPLSPHLDLAAEVVQVSSDRPARAIQFDAARQGQTQMQMALKVHF